MNHHPTKLGVIFPQTEIGSDPVQVRDYAQAAESLGYDYILAYDHVLGANVGSRSGWSGPYSHTDAFHEPFVLFGYLSGITHTIEFATGILILPQRQTVLVAKQAAAVDVLSGGRLRLGIGIGWNEVEYTALGQDFQTRGLRSEEQIQLIKSLWTNELVSYEGKWDVVPDAGINPMPIQQPIPVWFGGGADKVLRRIAKYGDGWISNMESPDEESRNTVDRLFRYAEEEGRERSQIGIEVFISASVGSPEDWLKHAKAWKEFGATHIAFGTMGSGYDSTQEHIESIRRFKDEMASL